MGRLISDMLPYMALFAMLWTASSCAQKKLDKIPKEEKLYEVTHTEEEWKQILTPDEYYILRKSGTERPWSSPLNSEKRGGLYVCAADSTQLFVSDDKFNSGTGWPSFSGAKNLEYEWDGRATEVRCITCGGHLGHLFKDGMYTNSHNNNRYCINGIALKFIPDEH